MVALALLVSWVAAIVVTPLAGFYLLKPHGSGAHDVFDTVFYRRLRRLIEWCLVHRKTVIGGTLLLFLLGVGGMALTEKQFFPSSNRLELLVELWLPEGSDIHATERETARLEKVLAGDKDVEAGAVSFRFGDRSQINGVPRDAAVDAIVDWIARRENETPNADLFKVDS